MFTTKCARRNSTLFTKPRRTTTWRKSSSWAAKGKTTHLFSVVNQMKLNVNHSLFVFVYIDTTNRKRTIFHTTSTESNSKSNNAICWWNLIDWKLTYRYFCLFIHTICVKKKTVCWYYLHKMTFQWLINLSWQNSEFVSLSLFVCVWIYYNNLTIRNRRKALISHHIAKEKKLFAFQY